ncbi:hypothetical protein [Cellulomonas marina]|uniref:Uncharacterized protein n=1 Tax=Cellulomonas marina TaxID=988821 RepID=A0A1I0ZG11_9CELL|nr:hypothetical protein [Cellulomonas marina]GIG28557.1 hypothetical protein Cma02nite_11570 [Cellulomonas marina]SFB24719.1 hypothetical protein SAMN05421867_11144 [Cellulomonas marina]
MAAQTPTQPATPSDPTTGPAATPAATPAEAVTLRGLDPLTGIGASWRVSPVERVEAGVPLYRVEWTPELAERTPWVLARRTTALVTQREAETLVARLERV